MKGVAVRQAICETCPLAKACGTLQQEAQIKAMGDRGLFVQSSAYLFLPSPAPTPDILIADEAVTIAAIADVVEFSPERIRDAAPYHGSDLASIIATNTTLNRLHDALQQPKPLAALRDAGVTIQDLRSARKALSDANEERHAPIRGDMSDEEIAAVLDSMGDNTVGCALITVRAVIREMEIGRDTLTGVVHDPARKVEVKGKEERMRRLRIHRLRDVRAIHRGTTVLLLDGTGSVALNRKLFGEIEHVRSSYLGKYGHQLQPDRRASESLPLS